MWQSEIIRFLSYLWTQPTLSLRANKWRPPPPLHLPAPNHCSNTAAEEERPSPPPSYKHTSRDTSFSYYRKGSKSVLEVGRRPKYLMAYLPERTAHFPTAPKSLWKACVTVSYAISREHRAHLGFLRGGMGDPAETLVFSFKRTSRPRAGESGMQPTLSIRSEECKTIRKWDSSA